MAMYRSAVLLVQAGPAVGREFPLDKETLTIGRALDNDMVLEDEQVSRHHANIRRQGDQFVLTDLASANGTFVDRVRITGPHVLRPGQLIQMGTTIVTFQAGGGAATVISPPAEETVIGRPPATAPPPRYAPPPSQPAYAPPPPPAYVSPQPAYAPPPAKKKKGGLGGWCGCLVVVIIIIVALIVLAVAGYFAAVMFGVVRDDLGLLTIIGNLIYGRPLQPGSLW